MIKFNDTINCKESKMEFRIAIKKLFEQYKIFMNCNTLSDFKINLFDSSHNGDETAALVKLPVNQNDEYILTVDMKMARLLQYKIVPTYYHEFTHIYDNEVLLPTSTYKERNLLLNVYSEFHAVIIQMQIATGFTSYNENKLLTLNSPITDFLDEMSLVEYFKKQLTSFTKELTDYKCDFSPKTYNYIFNHAIYYIAKMYFAQNYIKENETNLFNLKLFADILGNEIFDIANLLFENSIDIQILLEITKLNRNIVENFMSKAVCTNKN